MPPPTPLPALGPPLFSSHDPPSKTAGPNAWDVLCDAHGFDDLPSSLSSTLMFYIERPTLRRAHIVLRSYGIAMPPPQMLAALAAGGDGPAAPPVLPAAAAAALFEELRVYDTLNDLICRPSKTAEAIWAQHQKDLPPDAPPTLRADFLDSDEFDAFAQTAAAHLQRKAGIRLTSLTLPEGDAGDGTGAQEDLAAARHPTTRHSDAADSAAADADDGLPLDVVMDGVIPAFPDNNECNAGHLVLAGVSFAFLHVLFVQLSRRRLLPPSCRRLRLFDGFFLQLAHRSYIKHFLGAYLRSLQQFTGLAVRIEQLDLNAPSARVPVRFNALFGTRVALGMPTRGQACVFMDGVAYPLVQRVPEAVSAAEDANLPPYDWFSADASSVERTVYPQTKYDFYRSVKRALATESPASPAALRRLGLLHFLRDAYKAEMALQHGAFFMTHDRLSYLYYRMLGGTRGFLLTVHVHTGPGLPYRVWYKMEH
jgi:hypothetical protein